MPFWHVLATFGKNAALQWECNYSRYKSYKKWRKIFNAMIQHLYDSLTYWRMVLLWQAWHNMVYGTRVRFNRGLYFCFCFLKCRHFFEVWRFSFDIVWFIFKRGLFSVTVLKVIKSNFSVWIFKTLFNHCALHCGAAVNHKKKLNRGAIIELYFSTSTRYGLGAHEIVFSRPHMFMFCNL